MSEEQGYFLDGDHPANQGKQTPYGKQVDRNEGDRDAALDKSSVAQGYRGRIAGPRSQDGPAKPAEPAEPLTEVERLFPDRERVTRAQDFLQYMPRS
jgi:hypothetical protein